MGYIKKLNGTVLIAFATLLSFSNDPQDPLIRILTHLTNWTRSNPVEKAYLQLDKPYYAAGEDIWFKAYVVSGSKHVPSDLSRVLNVELLDAADSIKQSIKLHLDSGTAHGDFALPDTLRAGYYHIRAYTNYMRNAGSVYFFELPVTIINPLPVQSPTKPGFSEKHISGYKPDVQFFPEGGTFVNGLQSIVAFKAVKPNGLGIDVSGTINDNNGKEIARFKSTHLGMGAFNITPTFGANYRANITYPDGSTGIFPLPIATKDGYSLKISLNDSSKIAISVSASAAFKNNRQQLSLLAQTDGKVYYTKTFIQGSADFVTNATTSDFSSGIAQFTLFSSTGEPLAERLIFVKKADQLQLSVTANQENFKPRGLIELKLSANTNEHVPVAGNFSVAVTDESKVPVNEDSENQITAKLLLTSDLRGYVENPAYYFNHPGAKSTADLDVLMLTQGYRRFEWTQLLNRQIPDPKFNIEKDLHVSGFVSTPAGKTVSAGKVSFYDLDSIAFNREALTGQDGRFSFIGLTFDDSARMIIQARTVKNKRNVDIHMDPIVSYVAQQHQFTPLYNVDSLIAYGQSSHLLYSKQRELGLGNHVISLQEVIIREKKDLLKNSANLNGPGNADQIILGSELRKLVCIRIADCLQGRLLGVTFRNGIPYSTRDYRPMQLIVDGAYVEGSYLNTLNYIDVQSIEVLRNVGLTAIYGGQGGSGVLLVTTRKGGDNDEPQPIYGRGITTYYPKGYYKSREFYSPRYDSPKTNKQLADLRTTIYWQPELQTATNGIATFDYFNAASKGNYRVVVEGIDNNGRLGRVVYHYKVQ